MNDDEKSIGDEKRTKQILVFEYESSRTAAEDECQ